MAGKKLNMGICGAEGEGTGTDLIHEPSLLAYSGRSGGLAVGGAFTIGGEQDYIDMNDGKGRFMNNPTKKVWFGRDIDGMTLSGLVYNVRIEYDIVTLTQAEQAELYQRGMCC